MSFDSSRYTFNPWNNYSGVVMQQGRVQLDSDWNEWLAELSRRIQAETLDTLGQAVYPATTPNAFQIVAEQASDGSNHILIGPGRMYVDGILAENHGDPTTAVFDPALAELSNTPQPPAQPPPTPPVTGSIDYTQQIYLPNAPPIEGNGPFFTYLDVWQRPVTYLEDSNLIDPAVGVDTTGRLQTVWQVKLMQPPSGSNCPTSDSWWPAPSAGRLTTGPIATTPLGPCCLTSSTGYTGQENQFYRVEIHQQGAAASASNPGTGSGTATFKWSRDNGSVITGVTAITAARNSAGSAASQLSVLSLGRDQVLGFSSGDWIELLDDSLELNGQHGYLYQIDTVDFAGKSITLVDAVSGSFTFNRNYNPRIIRWDQSGAVYLSDGKTVWWDLGASGATGDIPVPPSGTVLILENGITLAFDTNPTGGSFLVGDFWTFAARTANGEVETLTKAPPRAIHHHYAPLSIVTFNPNSNTDCRTEWHPSAGVECGCCCSYTVGTDGQYSSINAAIRALPPSGGEVCILPGIYYENVFVQGLTDVVLKGCGWQTRIASASLNPNPPGSSTQAKPAQTSEGSGSTFTAVITVSASSHVKLESFAVEADIEDIGILLDGTGKLSSGSSGSILSTEAGTNFSSVGFKRPGVVDTTIEDLVIVSSDMPAILAQRVNLLEIHKNRIAMEDVLSSWPAVQVSGSEIRATHNSIGVLGTFSVYDWIPTSVQQDLIARERAAGDVLKGFSIASATPGGIQIAGPANNVLIAENEIDAGSRNGITLGSYTVLDANKDDTGIVLGVLTQTPDSANSIGLEAGAVPSSAPKGSTLVAGGSLANIQIDRNLIHNTGLCGIGPVAYFDFSTTPEVINVQGLSISSNTITNALQADITTLQKGGLLGYGVISLPDVQTLIIRDNTITNYGPTPGLIVCGIYLLLGEMVDISRNQIIETRDWQNSASARGISIFGRAGISARVTPPSFNAGNNYFKILTPIYEPGLPALRVENNVVRVPLSESLVAYGFGPFSIVNNHFACGGTVTDTGASIAQTVYIANLGTAVDASAQTLSFADFYSASGATSSVVAGGVGSGTNCGAITFTNNVCQLEGQVMDQLALTNVIILTLDYLNFSDNHCWVDGLPVIDAKGQPTGNKLTAYFDALLFGGSLNVNNNRFQEGAFYPVYASGLTYGILNITTGNISTYCLFADGPVANWVKKGNNIVFAPQLCPETVRTKG